jgi:nicotinate-nucleotide adenylyltransferase
VDARETSRQGPSYTVDTLRELKLEFPEAEIFLVIGADQARALPTWHQWQDILNFAIICVANRADSTWADPEFVPQIALKPRFLRLELPPSAISASEIRERIATHKSVAPLVCEPVARYIDHHHLYQTD